MRCRESGRSHLWHIVEVALLATIGFVAIQALPIYLRNRKLADHIRHLTGRAAAQGATPQAIQDNVVMYARTLELPVDRQNVKVGTQGGRLTIQLDYEVPVNLEVCTWVLHFEPSAEDWIP